MDKKLYQEQYDFELEQRNAISSFTNTPVVSITVVGGALSTMMISFSYEGGLYSIVFFIFIVIAVVATLAALYFVVRSVIGFSYQKIPSTNVLSEYYRDLIKWHEGNGTPNDKVEKEAAKDFEKYFLERMSEAADNNSANNIKRGNFIHDSTVAISIALTFLVFSAPFYIHARATKKPDIHQVAISSPVLLYKDMEIMTENNDTNSTSTPPSQDATPTTQPSAPAIPNPSIAKPSGPPNVVFRGIVGSTSKTLDPKTSSATSVKGENEKK